MSSRVLAVLLAANGLMVPAVVGAQSVAVPAGGAPGTARPAPPSRSAASPRWHASVDFLNVYEANINHDEDRVGSIGVVPGASLSFQTRGDQPAFSATYRFASSTYTNTDEWDRLSHGLDVVFTRALTRRVRLETEGIVTLKGSNEDRELADEYSVSQQVSWRLTRNWRVAGVGVYRIKRYDDDPDSNNRSPYVGGKVVRRLGADRRLEVGYRYETRRAVSPRDSYDRHTYDVELTTPVAGMDDRLVVGLRYRPTRYVSRLVRVGDGRELRADRRWLLGATYTIPLTSQVDWSLVYQLERRTSNDAAKEFTAPLVSAGFSYHWER